MSNSTRQVKGANGDHKYIQGHGEGTSADPFIEIIEEIGNEIALGNIEGIKRWGGLGERESMGTTATGEDVWRGNDLSNTPAALDDDTKVSMPDAGGTAMSVISESDADNGATATGALTVTIEYLDSDGVAQTIIKTMNGQSAVSLGVSPRFINDFYVTSVGSNTVAEGNIRIYKTADAGLVYNMIGIGGNQSLVPHKMVPLDKTLVLKGWNVSEAQGKRCAFRLRSTDKDGILISGVFLFKGTLYVKQSAAGEVELNVSVPALSVIKVSTWPDEVLAEGSCSWWGYLYDD